jgi:hypothetical protein
MKFAFVKAPSACRVVDQRLSHGRRHPVLVYRAGDYEARAAFNDPSKRVVVRFVVGGRMWAGLALKHLVPVRQPAVSARPSAPRALGSMLKNLTAIEAANRARALEASRAK